MNWVVDFGLHSFFLEPFNSRGNVSRKPKRLYFASLDLVDAVFISSCPVNSNGPILFNQTLFHRYGKSEIGQKIRGELRIGYSKKYLSASPPGTKRLAWVARGNKAYGSAGDLLFVVEMYTNTRRQRVFVMEMGEEGEKCHGNLETGTPSCTLPSLFSLVFLPKE